MLNEDHTLQPYNEPDPILRNAPHRVGAVTLVARDLARVSGFYQDVLGLSLLAQGDRTATVGAGGAVLLVLRHEPDARLWSPREAGLFHTAFLLPSRADLGAWLRHMAERSFRISGASDHLVSEAIYLTDPEGNGIEVYADRPSSAWPRAQGLVQISTERLDLDDVMQAAHASWSGMPPGSIIGHAHLQSGDLSRAADFYADLLGFEIMARTPGALFYSSGGYHHQLATNMWNSRGAPMRSDLTTGLAEVELLVKSAAVLDAMLDRLRRAGTPVSESQNGLTVHDPWGTALRLAGAAWDRHPRL